MWVCGRITDALPSAFPCRNAPPRFNSTFRLYSGPCPVVRLDCGAGLRLCHRARRRMDGQTVETE